MSGEPAAPVFFGYSNADGQGIQKYKTGPIRFIRFIPTIQNSPAEHWVVDAQGFNVLKAGTVMIAAVKLATWLALLLSIGVVCGQAQGLDKAKDLHFISCGLGSSEPIDALTVVNWSSGRGLSKTQPVPIDPQTISNISADPFKKGNFLIVGEGSGRDPASEDSVLVLQSYQGNDPRILIAKLDSHGLVATNTIGAIERTDGIRGFSWRGKVDGHDHSFFSKTDEKIGAAKSFPKRHGILFYAGIPGGPSLVPYLYVSRVGSELHIGRGAEGPVVDELSGAAKEEVPEDGGMVVGSDSHYFIFSPLNGSNPINTKLLIHDLRTHEWRATLMPGVGTRVRWFAPWLGGTVEHVRESNRVANPGRELEPVAIQNRYANQEGGNRVIDGQLWLYNIETQQTLTIETGQEDSEVLGIRNDRVYFRTTDAIFQARLTKAGAEAPQLLIRDSRLVRVHWMF